MKRTERVPIHKIYITQKWPSLLTGPFFMPNVIGDQIYPQKKGHLHYVDDLNI